MVSRGSERTVQFYNASERKGERVCERSRAVSFETAAVPASQKRTRTRTKTRIREKLKRGEDSRKKKRAMNISKEVRKGRLDKEKEREREKKRRRRRRDHRGEHGDAYERGREFWGGREDVRGWRGT